MKTSKNAGILFGVGVLGVGAMIGLAQPASAQDHHDKRELKDDHKDVVDARKDVRDDKRDIKHADSPKEHHEAVVDLHRDQRDLNRQKGELNRDRRDDQHPGFGHPGFNHPGFNHPGFGHGPVVVERKVIVEHPVIVRNDYGHPVYNGGYHGGGYNFGGGNDSRTVEGRMVHDLKGNDFVIRTSGGRDIRVLQPSGQSSRISHNDLIRAEGHYEGGTFVARHVQILRNR